MAAWNCSGCCRLEVNDDVCCAGLVDGHFGSATMRALELFQVFNNLEARHYCSEQTLLKLIDRYLEIIGPKRPKPQQIEIVGRATGIAPGN